MDCATSGYLSQKGSNVASPLASRWSFRARHSRNNRRTSHSFEIRLANYRSCRAAARQNWHVLAEARFQLGTKSGPSCRRARPPPSKGGKRGCGFLLRSVRALLASLLPFRSVKEATQFVPGGFQNDARWARHALIKAKNPNHSACQWVQAQFYDSRRRLYVSERVGVIPGGQAFCGD